MKMFARRAPLAATLVLTCWTAAGAVGVTGKKLVVVNKGAAGAKVVFVSKLDDGIEKGMEGDPAQLGATFSVGYGDDPAVLGSFSIPGAGWLVNKASVAKYVNKDAPTGGGVKVAVVKPDKVAKVVGKSLGDGPVLDLSGGAPSAAGGIVAILTVENGNDASMHQMCARFSTDDGSSVVYKEIAGGTGYKLVAKNGVPCPAPDPCEILNAAECFLPFPSSHFLVDDPSTETGLRVNLPAEGMPAVNGDPWLPDPYNELDGFSPMGPVLMHFPQGVDLDLSDAPRLLAPGCCGQPPGPPWVDTRTYTDRSLDADSPSVLIDADTGERVLHWLELDGRADGAEIPGRQVLFLRPAVSLVPGHRYIVAMRDLQAPGGADVEPESAFAALRDGTPTADSSIEARRARMESEVFSVLTGWGIDRASLVLAFDFSVQSDAQLTRQLVSMRDQAFAWLETVEDTPGLETFTVDSTTTNDCNVPGTTIWRHVSGTFESPLFLDGLPVQTGVQFLNVDANDVPVQNGFMNAPYDITIPCSIHDGDPDRPIVLGHGIFGTGRGMVLGVPGSKALWDDWTYIAGGTDWIGLSDRRDDASDIGWIGANIVGILTSKFNNFPGFVDRLRQGMLNQLVLGKMMKLGLFNRNAAFDHPLGGGGVFPGPAEEMYYYGISLGGVHGTLFAALTPDVERHALDVPAINFGCLLQRSTQFSAFDAIIQTVGVTDPMDNAILISLIHELWVSGEPAGFARHITTDPLPGSGGPKKLLYHQSWLDLQVSNQCTEIAVRTLGIPNLVGSLQSSLANVPDVAGPVDSANVTWDSGAFDIFDPLHEPLIPPLANIIPPNSCDPHNGPRQIPAAVHQLIAFLQPGGTISNTCVGTCDAVHPSEIPTGGRCDGTSPVMLQGANCEADADCGGGVCDPQLWCDPLNP